MIDDIVRLMKARFGADASHWSIIQQEETLDAMRVFLVRKPIKTLLEIGTHQGASAAFFSQFAEKVITIDCVDYPLRHKIWEYLGIKNIESHIFSPNNSAKEAIVNGLEFDFAFIDGDHKEGVILDYDLCKRCGRVMFHDYGSDAPEYVCIKNLVDGLPKDEVTTAMSLAYWEKK